MAENTTNNNKKKKRSFSEWAKSIDMKSMLKSFTLIWGLVLIVVMTITNFTINKNFDFLQWFSNAAIMFGIMIFGLLMGESMGEDKQKEKPNGLFQKSLNEYNLELSKAKDNIAYFNQFYYWYMPQELYRKKYDYLVDNGVDPLKATKILRYCDIEDLYELKQHIVIKQTELGEVRIRRLQEDEIEPVEKVLKGEIKLDASKPNYYLTAFGESDAKYSLEEDKQIDRLREKNKKRNRIVKIVSTISISLLFAVFTVSDFINGDDTQAWMNLVSRISALITSYTSGWMSMVVDVRLQCQKLANKITILNMFTDSLRKGLFIPKSEKELEEEEWQEYLKKQSEIIHGEVMPMQLERKGDLLENGK